MRFPASSWAHDSCHRANVRNAWRAGCWATRTWRCKEVWHCLDVILWVCCWWRDIPDPRILDQESAGCKFSVSDRHHTVFYCCLMIRAPAESDMDCMQVEPFDSFCFVLRICALMLSVAILIALSTSFHSFEGTFAASLRVIPGVIPPWYPFWERADADAEAAIW